MSLIVAHTLKERLFQSPVRVIAVHPAALKPQVIWRCEICSDLSGSSGKCRH